MTDGVLLKEIEQVALPPFQKELPNKDAIGSIEIVLITEVFLYGLRVLHTCMCPVMRRDLIWESVCFW